MYGMSMTNGMSMKDAEKSLEYTSISLFGQTNKQYSNIMELGKP